MLCLLCTHMIISLAMLKLTHSFCRYTKLTGETLNFNTTHVKRYSCLSRGRHICFTLYVQYPIVDSFTHTRQQLRLLANIRKKLRLKRTQNSCNETQVTRQINNRLLPSMAHSSQGGDSQAGPSSNSVNCDGAIASTSSHCSNNRRRDNIPANFRKWEQVSKRADGEPFRFRVVSYNMLAQCLLESHSYLYTDCNSEDLAWEVRFERLFKEIMDLNPDILCLQEVQSSHINNFYVRFEQKGYCGIYKRKTRDRKDGCAIYFKKNLFQLDDHLSVEYFQPEMPILNRDNVGLMVKLVPRGCPMTAIVVATTHFLYNPYRTDVRIAQLQVLLAELDRFAYYENDNPKNTGYHPIVLAGDFNSLPESAVIRLLESGQVNTFRRHERSDWRRIAITDNCQHLSVIINRPRGVPSNFSMIKLYNSERANNGLGPEAPPRLLLRMDQEVMRYNYMFNNPVLRHPLTFASVYPRDKYGNMDMATTFQKDWVTVDYIFFSCCNKLRLIERLRLPKKRECDVLGHLPNHVYGSDHLMLAATFEIRQNFVAY